MDELISYSVRVAVTYLMMHWIVRVGGKRLISTMTTEQLIATFLVSTIAAEPLKSASVIKSLWGVGLVIVLQLALSLLSLDLRLDRYIQPQPTLLVRSGQVDPQALVAAQLSLPQLISQVRLKGYAGLSEVEYAFLEPNGEVSVVPKPTARPLRPSDIAMPTQPPRLALPLVMDGAVIGANLRYAGVTEEWLRGELARQGYPDPARVFLAELDAEGRLHVQPRPAT